MSTRAELWRILAATAISLTMAMTPQAGWGDDDDDDDDEIEFSVANVFFELNDTDDDLGIHALIDGEAWEEVEFEDPRGRTILEIEVKRRLSRQGLTELFFESAEPTFDELAPEDFFRRFPEGEYEISGETIDGDEMESSAELTHVIPAPPGSLKVSGADAPEDCDEDPIPSVSRPVVITWDPVTESHPDLGKFSSSLEVVRYEIVVEREEPTSLVMSVVLPPEATSFQVPEDFIDLDSGDGFKFEILVREASGNQTATESCFEVQ